MSEKSNRLAEMRDAFVKKYASRTGEDYFYQDYFAVDLDRLIYLAFEVAQEPFALELKLYRENAVMGSALAGEEERIRK